MNICIEVMEILWKLWVWRWRKLW